MSSKVTDAIIDEIWPKLISDIETKFSGFRDLTNEQLVKITSNISGIIEEKISNIPKSQEIVVKRTELNGGQETKNDLGPQHERFPELLKLLQINVPVYIWGPTGSGKTTAAETAAKAMDLPFYRKVVSPQTSEGQIFGFHNGTGYIEGIAYKPYKDGGVLLIDEIDNGNPSINVCIKMLSDGSKCNFPCGIIEKHENFRLLANANTVGTGANRQYVGRAAQDAALLNIFGFLSWEYDSVFENTLSLIEYKKWHGENDEEITSLIDTVIALRKSIDELAIKHIISPRNLIYGSRMLAQKFPKDFILESCILRGLDKTQAEKILENAKKHFKEIKRQQLPSPKQEQGKELGITKTAYEAVEEKLKKSEESTIQEMMKKGIHRKEDIQNLKEIFVKNLNKDESGTPF